jgi:DNA-binding transcriptional LysR family regulator
VNVHHLELFFHVAKNEGISQAVRNMPYGIQQPAVSGQLLQLEEFLGTKLFNRRPFALTPAGEELYGFIAPFFANLGRMSEKMRGELGQQLRLAASATVLRDHLPDLFQILRKQFPRLKLALREATPIQAATLLLNQEIDVAITVAESRPPAGVQFAELLRLPLVLLVDEKSGVDSASDLLRKGSTPTETLIALPDNEPMARIFRAELEEREVTWPTGIEVNSLDLIQTYVAKGFGAGLMVEIPRYPFPKSIRVLPLRGFAPLVVGAFWQGKLSPVAARFLEEAKKRARWLASGPRTAG